MLGACTRGVDEPSPTGVELQRNSGDVTRDIISLSPSITETIYALGAGKRLLGVDRFSDQIPAAKPDLESSVLRIFGDAQDPKSEAILAAAPAHILVEGDSRARSLMALGDNVTAIPSTSLSEILAMWAKVGEICGAKDNASRFERDLDALLEAISFHTPPRVLLTYSSPSEGSLYCVGPSSYQSEVLRRFGAINVLEDVSTPTPQVSAETLFELDPDAIITILSEEPSLPATARWEGLKELRAVKEGQLIDLAGSEMTLYGPTSLLSFSRALRKALESWKASR
ncbi:MAG: ABC transporter substrate-binding protein [Planctomycetes bacterium]|nr:ABC transporter substrate-binding protein [Planctomycetota bacterium]